MKQYIKEPRSYHHACLFFFLCVITCLSLTLHKTLLNLQKKMFQCLGWMRKNFIPGNFSWSIAAETWDASCFKKGLLEKQQSVPNTCAILPLEKIFYQNLTVNRSIFQIPLKYINLVFQKYLLYWYYVVLIFTSKLRTPLPHRHHQH